MNLSNLGFLLLGVWMIAMGAMSLASASFPHSVTVMAVLAICSGVLIALGTRSSARSWW